MEEYRVIVGSGVTGRSVAAHFSREEIPHIIFEPGDIKFIAPEVHSASLVAVYNKVIPIKVLHDASEIVMSPGVDPHAFCKEYGSALSPKLTNDIELFCQLASKPIVAITGSNGKTTVTTLLEKALNAAGLTAVAGGNIGRPALELLLEHEVDYYVLELSSFQLELVKSLCARVAVVLNISEDHLERHHTLENYINIKAKIYDDCETALINKAWQSVACRIEEAKMVYFGEPSPQQDEYGLVNTNQGLALAFGDNLLMLAGDLQLIGRHNALNVLAVIAICQELGVDLLQIKQALRDFKGLAHRCEIVDRSNGVTWVNDSKGTNIAATVSAINGLRPTVAGKLVLILGGQSKTTELAELVEVIKKDVQHVLLFGAAKQLFYDQLNGIVPVHLCESLEDIVNEAYQLSGPGDCVLFSPACASYDMFKNYVERGETFRKLVKDVTA